jgi:predicted amidohydrolase
MQRLLKVAVLPIDIKHGDRDENLYIISQKIAEVAPDTDIVVLPELFSTGFISDPTVLRTLADSEDRELTLNFLRDLAAKHNTAICGSMLWREGANYFNRCVFIEPSGETTHYDKHHLFTQSKEPKILTAGTTKSPVVRYRGWNIAMAVCYDVRFAVWLRNDNSRYDLLIVPANWPNARAYDWKHLLIARAIENQACVVGANRSGEDSFGDYNDNSYVIDHRGREVGETTNGIITATLSLNKLEKYRTDFPVLADADTFIINPTHQR